jgi:hypothetical protein
MPRLRRSLESEPAHQVEPQPVAAMMSRRGQDLISTRAQLAELIAAIDRRLPQVQRAGEGAIANAATRLRIEATRRIAEIDVELSGPALRNANPDIVS